MPLDSSLICLGMGSGSGSNLRELIRAEDGYSLALLFSDRQSEISDLALKHNRAYMSLNAKSITGTKPDDNELNNYINACERYENLVLQQISAWEMQNHNIDLVLLGGYMRLLRQPFMQRFEGRILNVHPGDLSIEDPAGERLLIGSKAVLKALLLGLSGTKSSIHIVTSQMDAGPIIATSELIPFADIMLQIRDQILMPLLSRIQINEDNFNSISSAEMEQLTHRLKKDFPVAMKEVLRHCKEHQNKQKELADWPVYTKSVVAIAKGDIKLPTIKKEGIFAC